MPLGTENFDRKTVLRFRQNLREFEDVSQHWFLLTFGTGLKPVPNLIEFSPLFGPLLKYIKIVLQN